MRRFCFAVAMLALGTPGALLAQAETTTFEYDAQGRLTESTRSGGPASGMVQALTYDAAGNRTNQTVTGAPGGAGLMGSPGGLSSDAPDADAAAEDSGVDDYVAPTDDPPVSQGAPAPPDDPVGGGMEPGA
ncbi:MAG: hypothetical protein H7X93_10075 [Sphingomonadaceae bacterium]|nr:hypothetical protein [Sphingomonadaceae bacterium]